MSEIKGKVIGDTRVEEILNIIESRIKENGDIQGEIISKLSLIISNNDCKESCKEDRSEESCKEDRSEESCNLNEKLMCLVDSIESCNSRLRYLRNNIAL